MQVSIHTMQSFAELSAELSRCPHNRIELEASEVFQHPDWFNNLAHHGLVHAKSKGTKAPAGKLHLVLICDDQMRPVMCLPLLCNGIVTGLRNYYSSLFGPIHWKQHGHAPANNLSLNVLWVSLGNHLFTNCKHFPSVRLDPLPRNSETLACAHEGLCSAGYWVDRFFCFGNWYLPVNGQTFENYYTNLPSGLRHNLAKGRKKLSNSGNWEITIQSAEDHLIDKAVQDFVSVYNLSWKEAEPNPNFIPNLIRLAATKGWLRLGLLSLNGQAIAAQLWLVHGGKAYIFKLAYIAGLEKFSPGSVLTCAMMQHVMEKDLVGEIDYLTGDDAYKRDWMTHRRERWGIVAFHPRSLRGIWAAFVHFAGKQFRNA